MSAKARYVMIGGFLGAGKTTAVGELAKRLDARGLKVGLITNDQSSGLVDTSILRSRGFAVEEIAGGCFCCRFQSLSEAAERLTASTRPDVFIAEPVGSCTDLVATVSYPLRRIYGDRFTIAPLSVLVDPTRAARVLGLAGGRSFSKKVAYVYEKQLEEADRIVINKVDQVEPELLDALSERLSERFPNARQLRVSALHGTGLDAWFDELLETEVVERPTMELDYQLYAEGEALLGWLNMTIDVRSNARFDANAFLGELAEHMSTRLAAAGHEIAHLKMTLESDEAGGQLAALSQTIGDGMRDLREALIDGVHGGQLIVNLRAEADPDELLGACRAALDGIQRDGLRLELQHSDHFRPAPPTPTHRVTSGEEARG